MSEQRENNIRVLLRIKPCQDERQCTEVLSADTIRFTGTTGTMGPNNTRSIDNTHFTFDAIGGPDCGQMEVWGAVAKDLTEQCLAGYNATVFAYGQTGSGKTWTMQGRSDANDMSELTGIIPRTFDYLFSKLHEERSLWEEVIVKCSFFEIYNEAVYDLLVDENGVRQVREDVKRKIGGQVYVEGGREEVVLTASEAISVFRRGAINRHVAETRMNRESSRSHSVFTLTVTKHRRINGLEEQIESRFNLVDLAGSERQQSTGTVGVRLKEAGNINKSLLALSNVINALANGDQCSLSQNSGKHVHYRDSKLTFLLRDSLGGNSKTAVIACVSPAWSCQGETLSTLRFAQRAKMIKNIAVVNQDVRGSVEDLQNEIKRLQGLLNVQPGPQPLACELDIDGSTDDGFARKLLSRAKLAEDHLSKASERIQALELYVKRREQQANSDKLIIKFRDKALQSLSDRLPVEYKEFLQEADELRRLLEQPPEFLRMTCEQKALEERVTELQSLLSLTDADYVKGLECRLKLILDEDTGMKSSDEIEFSSINANSDKELIDASHETGEDPLVKELQDIIDQLARQVCSVKMDFEKRKSEFDRKEAEHLDEAAALNREIAKLAQRLEHLESEKIRQMTNELERTLNDCKKMEFQLTSTQQDNELLLHKLTSLPTHTFEIANLRERLAELHAENERLRSENDKLVQHHNLKQKLQYHVKIKQENNDLKAELLAAKEEIFRLSGSCRSPSK